MSLAIWSLIGVIIGAFANNFGGEYYKRFRDRRALAFALAGEIGSHIQAVEGMKLLEALQAMALRAREGGEVPLPPFEPPKDLVFEKAVEKIGLLEGDIPKRLVTFYGFLNGARRQLQLAGQGYYGTSGERLSAVLMYLVENWNDWVGTHAKTLTADLETIGTEGFWHHVGSTIRRQP